MEEYLYNGKSRNKKNSNGYGRRKLLYKDGRGLIIDPGEGFEKIQKAVEELGVKIEAILLTHAHFDHIMSLDECRKYYNVPVYISP